LFKQVQASFLAKKNKNLKKTNGFYNKKHKRDS